VTGDSGNDEEFMILSISDKVRPDKSLSPMSDAIGDPKTQAFVSDFRHSTRSEPNKRVGCLVDYLLYKRERRIIWVKKERSAE